MESGGYGLAAGRADPAEDGPAGGVERRLSRKRHRVQLSHTRLRASPAGALLRRGTRKPQRARRSGTRRPRSWSRRSPAGSREEIERAILEPTDATELYAEELVRLAAERGVDAGFPGSVQALIAAGLPTLSHKELVRPTCTSSREGVAEYVFWHALAPDVACPRADRTALAGAGAFESAELIRAERDARAARDRRR
jgi:hypothetical protein